MKIVIFGANGGIGKELVQASLDAGFDVVGITHSSKAVSDNEHLSLLQGDVTDDKFVRQVTADADVIVSAIGMPNPKQSTTVFSVAAKNLAEAAQATDSKRLIVLSAGGATVEANDSLFVRYVFKPILWKFLPHLYADLIRMEHVIEASDTNWTIMRLSRLTNKPMTGKYRTAQNAAVAGGLSIGRADVAHYIAQHYMDPQDYKQFISIAY